VLAEGVVELETIKRLLDGRQFETVDACPVALFDGLCLAGDDSAIRIEQLGAEITLEGLAIVAGESDGDEESISSLDGCALETRLAGRGPGRAEQQQGSQQEEGQCACARHHPARESGPVRGCRSWVAPSSQREVRDANVAVMLY